MEKIAESLSEMQTVFAYSKKKKKAANFFKRIYRALKQILNSSSM